jgi:hypothetical protein
VRTSGLVVKTPADVFTSSMYLKIVINHISINDCNAIVYNTFVCFLKYFSPLWLKHDAEINTRENIVVLTALYYFIKCNRFKYFS